eukprot:gene17510-26938_t
MSQLKKASKLELLKRVNESIVRAARAKNEKVFDNALLQTVCHRMSRGVELGGIEATTMAVVRDELKGRVHLYPLLGMVPVLRALQRLKDPAGLEALLREIAELLFRRGVFGPLKSVVELAQCYRDAGPAVGTPAVAAVFLEHLSLLGGRGPSGGQAARALVELFARLPPIPDAPVPDASVPAALEAGAGGSIRSEVCRAPLLRVALRSGCPKRVAAVGDALERSICEWPGGFEVGELAEALAALREAGRRLGPETLAALADAPVRVRNAQPNTAARLVSVLIGLSARVDPLFRRITDDAVVLNEPVRLIALARAFSRRKEYSDYAALLARSVDLSRFAAAAVDTPPPAAGGPPGRAAGVKYTADGVLAEYAATLGVLRGRSLRGAAAEFLQDLVGCAGDAAWLAAVARGDRTSARIQVPDLLVAFSTCLWYHKTDPIRKAVSSVIAVLEDRALNPTDADGTPRWAQASSNVRRVLLALHHMGYTKAFARFVLALRPVAERMPVRRGETKTELLCIFAAAEAAAKMTPAADDPASRWRGSVASTQARVLQAWQIV